MKFLLAFRQKNREVFIVIPALVIGIFSGYLVSLLFRAVFDVDPVNELSDYLKIVKAYELNYGHLMRYLAGENMKRFLFILLLCFTLLGLPASLYQFFKNGFQFGFFGITLISLFGWRGVILSAAYFLLPFLCYLFPLLFCIRQGLTACDYLISNRRRFYMMTKNQLQSFVKIGMIMMLVILISAIIETYFGTFFIRKALSFIN